MFFCLWNNDWEKHTEPEKPCDSTHLTETTEGMCWRKGHNSFFFCKNNKGGQHWDHGGECVVRDSNERKRTPRAAFWHGCQGPVLQPKRFREGIGLSFTIYYKDNINFLWKRLRPSG